MLPVFLALPELFMLANAIISGIYQSQVGGSLIKDIFSGRHTVRSPFSFINPTYFAVLILGWINYIAMNVVIVCYMKVYDTLTGQQPTIQEVWEEFKKYFLKVFCTQFLLLL
ncbi:MAG: hypothetical protein WKG06_07980 [Segetibacter sp.]